MARIPLLARGGVPVMDFSALGNLPQTFQQGRLSAERLQDIAEARSDRERQREADAALSTALAGADFSTPGGFTTAGQNIARTVGASGLPTAMELIRTGGNLERQALQNRLTQARLGEVGAGRRQTQEAAKRERQARAQFLVDQGISSDLPTALRAVDAGFADELFKRATEEPDQPKPPTGFRFVEGGTRLEPIPGGPGERLSGEIAGRIGLAEDALKQLPGLVKKIEEGAVTGAWDAAKAATGTGEPGRIIREVTAGAEALTRMLTGAGMNQEEAKREARLYIPGPTDTAQTAANKVRELQRRLRAVSDVASRGRGGRPETTGQSVTMEDGTIIRPK